MKRADANRIAEAQIAAWLERNRDPGVLPSIPVILISSLTGDKPGITLNLNINMPLTDVVTILKAATEQVQNTIKKMEENGGQTALPLWRSRPFLPFRVPARSRPNRTVTQEHHNQHARAFSLDGGNLDYLTLAGWRRWRAGRWVNWHKVKPGFLAGQAVREA